MPRASGDPASDLPFSLAMAARVPAFAGTNGAEIGALLRLRAMIVPVMLMRRRGGFRIERRVERRQLSRPSRATCPPAHDRVECGSCRRRSARRCGGCRDARPAARCRARCRRKSRPAFPAGPRPARSSRRRAPAHRRRAALTGLATSSRNCVPFSPSARCAADCGRRRRARRGPSADAAGHWPAGLIDETRCIDASYSGLSCPRMRGSQQSQTLSDHSTETRRLLGPRFRGDDVPAQNKKYLCAIGSTSAGAQVSNSPSARTS